MESSSESSEDHRFYPSTPTESVRRSPVKPNATEEKVYKKHTRKSYTVQLNEKKLRKSNESDLDGSVKLKERFSRSWYRIKTSDIKLDGDLTTKRPAFVCRGISSKRCASVPTKSIRKAKTDNLINSMQQINYSDNPETPSDAFNQPVNNQLEHTDSITLARRIYFADECSGSVSSPNRNKDAKLQALGDECNVKRWNSCCAFSTPVYLHPISHPMSSGRSTDMSSTGLASSLSWGLTECTTERPICWHIQSEFNTERLTDNFFVLLIGMLVRPGALLTRSPRTVHSSSEMSAHEVEIEPDKLLGVIRVRNITFEKRVCIRASTDDWVTWKDYPAIYWSGNDDQGRKIYDQFTFQLVLPDNADKFEFAVKYTWGNGDRGGSLWDNNEGENYVLHKRSMSTEQEITVTPVAKDSVET